MLGACLLIQMSVLAVTQAANSLWYHCLVYKKEVLIERGKTMQTFFLREVHTKIGFKKKRNADKYGGSQNSFGFIPLSTLQSQF